MEIIGYSRDEDLIGYVYGLFDPRTHDCRYIGKAKDPARRAATHLMPSYLAKEDTYKARWLRGLLHAGYEPVVIILSEVTAEEDLNDVERFWIRMAKKFGWPITNATAGGDGGVVAVPHRWTAEERLAQSLRQKGRRWTADDPRREQIRKRQQGRPLPQSANTAAAATNTRTWRVVDPDGAVLVVRNLRVLCAERGLSCSKLYAVARGEVSRKQYKGWTCTEVTQ